MHTLRRITHLARPYRRRFAIVGGFALAATAADLLQPLVYRRAIDAVAGMFTGATSPEQILRTLLLSVALLFLIATIGYLFTLCADYTGARVASDMESGLITSTFGHVLRLPLKFFSDQSSAGLARRIDQSDRLAPVVYAFVQQVAPEAIRLVGICAIMLTQNWEMALVAMSMLPPYLWIARRSAVKTSVGLEPYYELWEKISARIADAVSAIKTVKLSGAEAREEQRLRHDSEHAYRIYLDRLALTYRFYFSQSVVSNLSKALVLGYGGWLVLRRRLTPGDVVMFVAYLDRLFAPVDSLNSMAVNVQRHLTSLQRALRLLDEGPVEEPGVALAPGPGRVEFRQVHFAYAEDRAILRGLNLTLEAGKITALAGPSGAGKTTTVDLLLKLYEPGSGEILLDGRALSNTGAAPVRAAIGVVATDGDVFRRSLADNIRYKRPAATDADVLDAALAAGLGRLLDRLPEGLGTEVGEHGVGLSVGEQQRLQIARILVDKPRVLVLDEATANLDFATEREVRDALARLSPRPTMLIVAHRYTMVEGADYVYVLKDGSVAEEGTVPNLLAAGGWFAELARAGGDRTAL